jgi:hypothetical protein
MRSFELFRPILALKLLFEEIFLFLLLALFTNFECKRGQNAKKTGKRSF